jgi:hypothetical protein
MHRWPVKSVTQGGERAFPIHMSSLMSFIMYFLMRFNCSDLGMQSQRLLSASSKSCLSPTNTMKNNAKFENLRHLEGIKISKLKTQNSKLKPYNSEVETR